MARKAFVRLLTDSSSNRNEDWNIIADWANDRVFTYDDAAPGASNFRLWSHRGSTGELIDAAIASEIFTTSGHIDVSDGYDSGSAMCLGNDGFLYFVTFSASPNASLAKVDPDTLLEVATTPLSEDWIGFAIVRPLTIEGVHFISVFYRSEALALSDLFRLEVFKCSDMTSQDVLDIDDIADGIPGLLTKGYQTSSTSARVVGLDREATSTDIYVYTFDTITGLSGGLTFSWNNPWEIFAPGDAEWVSDVLALIGLCVDETDGHILFRVQPFADGTTAKAIKANPLTGDIDWNIETYSAYDHLTLTPESSSMDNVEDGTWAFLDKSGSLYIVQTDTGAFRQIEGISVFSSLVQDEGLGEGAEYTISDPPVSDPNYHTASTHWDSVHKKLCFYIHLASQVQYPHNLAISDVWTFGWCVYSLLPGPQFSEYKDTSFLDWTTEASIQDQGAANYESFLKTYFHFQDDNILWMNSPYVYTYLNNTSRNASNPSLFMNGLWDWTEDSNTSHKRTRQIQLYDFKQDQSVSNTKNRVRGSGRGLQLKFTSDIGLDWNLLGWGIFFDKNTKY